jgi:hypothetical protein
MGTRIRIPLDGTDQDLGTPLFPARHFHEGNVVGHIRGPGPASLSSGYGSTHRSINCGVPFWKGTGVFWRAGRGPEWNANAAGSSQLGEFSDGNRVDQGSAVPNSFSTSQI